MYWMGEVIQFMMWFCDKDFFMKWLILLNKESG